MHLNSAILKTVITLNARIARLKWTRGGKFFVWYLNQFRWDDRDFMFDRIASSTGWNIVSKYNMTFEEAKRSAIKENKKIARKCCEKDTYFMFVHAMDAFAMISHSKSPVPYMDFITEIEDTGKKEWMVYSE